MDTLTWVAGTGLVCLVIGYAYGFIVANEENSRPLFDSVKSPSTVSSQDRWTRGPTPPGE